MFSKRRHFLFNLTNELPVRRRLNVLISSKFIIPDYRCDFLSRPSSFSTLSCLILLASRVQLHLCLQNERWWWIEILLRVRALLERKTCLRNRNWFWVRCTFSYVRISLDILTSFFLEIQEIIYMFARITSHLYTYVYITIPSACIFRIYTYGIQYTEYVCILMH